MENEIQKYLIDISIHTLAASPLAASPIGGEVRCRRAECSEQAHFLFRSKMTAQSNIKCAQTWNIDQK